MNDVGLPAIKYFCSFTPPDLLVLLESIVSLIGFKVLELVQSCGYSEKHIICLCLVNFVSIVTLMENVVDDVFDDLLEQDEVFDEEMEIVETVFCDLDGGSVVPDD